MAKNDSAFSALAAAASLGAPGADLKIPAGGGISSMSLDGGISSYSATAASSDDGGAAVPDLIDGLVDYYSGRTAELLGQETRQMELLGEFNERAAQIEAVRNKRNAQAMARQLGEEISRTAGEQTAGYLKAGVTLAGTPALLLKDTYEKGAEDLMALEESASFEEQQILLSGALSRMEAQQQAARIRVDWVENQAWNLTGLFNSPISQSSGQVASLGAGGSAWRA